MPESRREISRTESVKNLRCEIAEAIENSMNC